MEKKKVVSRKQRKGQIDNDRSNPQPTIEKKKGQRIECIDEYWNFNSHVLIPVTKETLIRLGQNGVRWATENEKAYNIKKFLTEQGIAEGSWARWCNGNPELAAYRDQMKMIIGCRREDGMIERRFDTKAILKMQPMYDADYKEMMEWESNLMVKNLDSEGGNTKFIVIPECPRSSLVPDREIE